AGVIYVTTAVEDMVFVPGDGAAKELQESAVGDRDGFTWVASRAAEFGAKNAGVDVDVPKSWINGKVNQGNLISSDLGNVVAIPAGQETASGISADNP